MKVFILFLSKKMTISDMKNNVEKNVNVKFRKGQDYRCKAVFFLLPIICILIEKYFCSLGCIQLLTFFDLALFFFFFVSKLRTIVWKRNVRLISPLVWLHTCALPAG